jgi:hypothetical protein
MLSRSVLISLGLTQVDIDDLDKDRSIHSIPDLRNLIMSLYLRATESEEDVEDLWSKIVYLKQQTVVMFSCGFTIGILLSLYLNNL